MNWKSSKTHKNSDISEELVFYYELKYGTKQQHLLQGTSQTSNHPVRLQLDEGYNMTTM